MVFDMGYDCKSNFIVGMVFFCYLTIAPASAENYGRPTLTDEDEKVVKGKYSRVVLFGDSQLDTNNVSKAVEISGSGLVIGAAMAAKQSLPVIFTLPLGTPFTSGNGNAAQQIFGYDFTRSNPLAWGADWTMNMGFTSITTGTIRINSVGLKEEKIDNTKNVNMAQGGAKLNKTFPGTNRALLAGVAPVGISGIAESILPSLLGDRDVRLLKPIVDQPKEFSNKGGSFGPRDMAMLLAGGNDAIAQGYDGEADLQFAKNELYASREKALGDIAKQGAKSIFFGNLPDLRLTPELINWTPGGKNNLHLGVARETAIARARITDLLLGANENTTASMLRVTRDNPGTTVTLFDIFRFIQHVAADRERYGIVNDISVSCTSVPKCNEDRASEGGKYFTEDGLHPSEKTSEIIANAYKYYLRDPRQPLMSRINDEHLGYVAYFDAFADIVVTKENSGLTHNVVGGVLDLSLKSQVDSLTPKVVLNGALLRFDDGTEKNQDSQYSQQLSADLLIKERFAGIEVSNASSEVLYTGNASGSALLKSGLGTLALIGKNYFDGGGAGKFGIAVVGGVLQVGNGGDTGSLSSDVMINNKSSLAFNHSTDHSFANNVVGTGALLKKGTGVLTLTGDNAHTGGTTISAGTLQIGDGSDKGSLEGDVHNEALLAFNHTVDRSFTGNAEGTGALLKKGTGVLTLTGDNAHTGGTTISAGTLQIGDGSDMGSLEGDVHNEALLAFNHRVDRSFTGNAEGTGALLKKGTGVLTLTGDNTHTGGTTISAGTLQIGNGSDKGWLQGNVVNDALMVFNRGDNKQFDSRIDGSGSIVKIGTGSVNLTGSGSVTGRTEVRRGKLGFNGLFDATDVQVNHGALVFGGGAVRSLSLEAGGTIAPGNSIGTFNVINDIVFNKGSVYSIEANAAGLSDMIKVGGVADIKGGDVLVDAESGQYSPTSQYTVLSTRGGVNGQFDSVSANFAFLDPSLNYGMSDVSLSLVRNDVKPIDLCQGANEKAVCAELLPVVPAPGTAVTPVVPVVEPVVTVAPVIPVVEPVVTVAPVIPVVEPVVTVAPVIPVVEPVVTVAPVIPVVEPVVTVAPVIPVVEPVVTVAPVIPVVEPVVTVAPVIPVVEPVVTVAPVIPVVEPVVTVAPVIPVVEPVVTVAPVIPVVEPVVTVAPVIPVVEPVVTVTPVIPVVETVLTDTPVIPVVEPVVTVAPVVPVVEPVVAVTPDILKVIVGERNDLLERENAVVIGMSKSEFTRLATLLPGDIHPTVKTVLAQESSYIRDSISKRLYETEKGLSNSGAWGYVFGSEGRQNGARSISGLSRNTQGFILGSDVWVEDADLSLGVFGGYRKTSMSQRASSADIGTYNLGIYGSKRYDAFSVRLGASFSWHDIETKRKINYKGSVSTPDADYHGNTAQLFSELAYDLKFDRFSVEPFIGLSYNRLDVSRFSEEKDLFSLSGKRDVKDIYASTMGARVNYSTQYNDSIKVSFQAGAGLKHSFSDVPSNTNMTLHSRGNDFRISGLPLKKNIAQLNTKVAVQTKGGFSVGLDYIAEKASGMRDQSISAFGSLEF